MNAYEILEPLLRGGGPSALFPPLDGDGASVAVLGRDLMIVLEAPPEREDSAVFGLSMPLLSLQGADDDVRLAFLWRLAEASAPGALPPGYVLYADREDDSVSLGGQFSALGIGAGTLETLADEFQRWGQVLRAELAERLKALDSEARAGRPGRPDRFGEAAAPAAAPADAMLRV
jgi:hypothetical protein